MYFTSLGSQKHAWRFEHVRHVSQTLNTIIFINIHIKVAKIICVHSLVCLFFSFHGHNPDSIFLVLRKALLLKAI